MMTITIFGATGKMQHILVGLALKKGYRVIGYARNPEKMNIRHPNLTLVQGTMEDKSTIAKAIANSDAVIETVGAVSKGTQNIISIMEQKGPKRLIVVSTTNVGDANDLPDLKFTFFMAFTRLLLKLIGLFNTQIFNAVREVRKAATSARSSNLEWTLVRIAVLNNKPISNKIHAGYLGRRLINLSISRADMASFILEQVVDQTYIKQAPAISN
jgi:hypothetical protein